MLHSLRVALKHKICLRIRLKLTAMFQLVVVSWSSQSTLVAQQLHDAKEPTGKLFIYARMVEPLENHSRPFVVDEVFLNGQPVVEFPLDAGAFARVSPNASTISYQKVSYDEPGQVWSAELARNLSTNQLFFVEGTQYDNSAIWSSDGSDLVISAGGLSLDRKIWKYKTYKFTGKDKSLVRLHTPVSDAVQDWSIDQLRFLTLSHRGPNKTRKLYVMKQDSTEQICLAEGSINPYPRFSPDGLSVLFSQFANETTEVWTTSIDGTNRRRILAVPKGFNVSSFTWSPEGRYIAYCNDQDNMSSDSKHGQPAEREIKRTLELADLSGVKLRSVTIPGRQILSVLDWR